MFVLSDFPVFDVFCGAWGMEGKGAKGLGRLGDRKWDEGGESCGGALSIFPFKFD